MKKDFNKKSSFKAQQLARKILCEFSETSALGFPLFLGHGFNPNIPKCLELVKAGADVRVIGAGNQSLPILAAKHNPKLMEELIEKGAPLDVQRKSDGDTALHVAIHWGKIEAAEMLIEAGARSDIMNNNGVTAREMAQNKASRLVVLIDAKQQKVLDTIVAAGTAVSSETAPMPEIKKTPFPAAAQRATP